MAANRFFSPVVRIQGERGHHLITAGPYRFLRHPGYVGTIIGSGIFLVPHDMAQRVGSAQTLLLVWVVGAALSLA